MEKSYKYRFDRRTIYWTTVYLVIFLLLGGLLYHLYEGGYFSAWFTSFVVALVALMSLSIPRRIVVGDEKVEVRCLLDITELRRDEIASVRRVDEREMKWLLPLFCGCGFFGYYGHFFDLRRFDRVRIYASEWKNFVEIVDIYEDRLYVSCSRADELVASLAPPAHAPAEDPADAPSDASSDAPQRVPEQKTQRPAPERPAARSAADKTSADKPSGHETPSRKARKAPRGQSRYRTKTKRKR